MRCVSSVLRVASVRGDNRMLILAWCPACDRQHPYWVQDPGKPPAADHTHLWTWDGNLERPTIGPSLLVHPDAPVDEHQLVDGYRPQVLCHSFLNDGVWDFLADCQHAMAGQRVPMVPLPDWLAQLRDPE